MTRHALGVDIGGTGIKAAPVDVASGRLLADRVRVLTPHPATPDAITTVVAELVGQIQSSGPIGIAFPAAVKNGVTLSATNVDRAWINADASRAFRLATRRPVTVINDADAAGLAEVRHGAAAGVDGVVIVLTLGTGIGCALFANSVLVPNTELGHLPIRGKDAEQRASDAARSTKGYSWKKWAEKLNEYLLTMERLFYPDLFVLGGGAVKNAEKFFPYLHTRTRLVPAALGNNAGIVGAAMAASVRPQQKAQPDHQEKHAEEPAQHDVIQLHSEFGAEEHARN
jgi:polyphosphate glucokinase